VSMDADEMVLSVVLRNDDCMKLGVVVCNESRLLFVCAEALGNDAIVGASSAFLLVDGDLKEDILIRGRSEVREDGVLEGIHLMAMGMLGYEG